ncbi:membrane protein [Gordonia phage Finkle]|uniref:Membrane protein n=1 Tax=Gordonia phage Finkle TaxID=2926099 RepID=A0A9E7NK65_9CAUD|nr:membrane protein [Gordonia phage Finkle]UTN92955.1 membrane protein [Gordonia phage Finkle]
MSALKDAALYALGAYALYTVGVGQWVLWAGGALAVSAAARAAYAERHRNHPQPAQ